MDEQRSSGGEGPLRRRPRPDPSEFTSEQLAEAATAMSRRLGAAEPGAAAIAALERLTELRAAGKFSEEDYARERRRLLGLG